jgi:hypothetical protein
MLRTLRLVRIGIVLSLLAASCATQLTERGARIKIISAEEAKSYEYVGIVEGSSSLTGLARHTGYQNALNEVLDRAAAMGADFVVIGRDSAPRYWTTSEHVRGEAYKKR